MSNKKQPDIKFISAEHRYFMISTEWGMLLRVSGVFLEENYAGLLYFGHKRPEGDYGITEFSTGLSVGYGKHPREALAIFRKYCKTKTISEFLERVNKRLKSFPKANTL